MKYISILFFAISLSFSFISCGGAGQEQSQENQESAGTQTEEPKAHGEGKEYTSAYVCPMHCEGSGSEEAGKCPKCGMDYVALNDHTKDEHAH